MSGKTNEGRKNELRPELLALHALNSFVANNAPARSTMFASHFAQRLIFDGSEPSLIQTGVEEEFGKYTFSVKMPADGTILHVIPRYRSTAVENSIDFNPETLVVYRNHETGEVDYFTIPYHLCNHPQFGFKYEARPALESLAVGKEFPKDTIFADSPAVKGEHHYTYGVNLNVVYMSHPNVGLDQFVINRDALKRFKFRVYETRHFNVGASSFPLFINGTADNPKIIPDIGDYIREDGLVFASRKFDPLLSPALLGKNDLREVDHLFDTCIYSRAGRGKVVDISVIRSDNVNRRLPPQMTKQFEKYADANEQFYNQIIRVEEQLISESLKTGNGGKIRISRPLQRLLVVAKGITNYQGGRMKQPIRLTYKREPLDTWRVTMTIEYEVTLDRGGKLSCIQGGKGVIGKIEEPENMPVDSDGNVADLITSPDSVPGRMNLGRLYAPYFNSAARDVRKQMLEELGYDRNYKGHFTEEEFLSIPDAMIQKAISTLLEFYSIVSPRSYKEFTENLTPAERTEWMLQILNKAIYLYMPIEDEEGDLEGKRLFYDEMVMEIEKRFKITYGPVTYVGRSGRKTLTKNKFRIAPLYIMPLDKIADTWLAVDIGKHSNFGILAAMNETDKFSVPWHRTPPRTIGETEGRLYNMYGGREMIAEMLDRSGNIETQYEAAKVVLRADKPTNIERLIDRNKIPLGNSRSNQIAHHTFMCMGFNVVYEPEDGQ